VTGLGEPPRPAIYAFGVPIGVAMWRIQGGKAVTVERTALASEKLLEDILEADIGLLGLPNRLLILGRQVPTDYGGRVDLLCIDQEGTLYVIEVKKDRTPREVVAQALDYGYWVRDLGYQHVRDIWANNHDQTAFDEAFRDAFRLEPPEAVNVAHQLVIVASALDPASERIVTYAKGFDLPINVVFFQTFQQDGVQYLTRTWLIDPTEEVPARKASQLKKQQEPWNGKDWYVSFGEGDSRSWDDARRYGFVSAGGGRWYTQTLRILPIGGRVFVNVPGRGYVGVGIVTGAPLPARDFRVSVDGESVPVVQAQMKAPHIAAAAALDDDDTEWFVPVSWIKTKPVQEAVGFKGRYGNQNSATKLTHSLTRETVLERLGINEEPLDGHELSGDGAPS
jgi:hypothetical protein